MNIGNKRVAIGIGLLISAFFLYLAFQGLAPDQFFNSLRNVNILLLLVGASVYFLAVTVIALRWQFLLRAVQMIPLFPLTQIVAIGYMGNNVYPLRAGEALRIYLLRRNFQVPVARATTTVVVERVLDGLVMLSFILFSLTQIDIQSGEVTTVVTFATPLFVTAMLCFLFLAAQPNLLRRLIKLLIGFLPDKLATVIGNISEDIIAGLEGLRSPVYLMGTVVSSFVTWGIEAVVYWIVMFAFGLELSYPVALLVVGTVNLAGLIPASPGQVGVYEFFVSTVMIAMGVQSALATTYAVVVHLVIWLPVTLVGFFFLIRQGMGWSDITHAQDLEEQSA
jgi:glycosyltransferase 2 family protein